VGGRETVTKLLILQEISCKIGRLGASVSMKRVQMVPSVKMYQIKTIEHFITLIYSMGTREISASCWRMMGPKWKVMNTSKFFQPIVFS
jgi:hypothetical protein